MATEANIPEDESASPKTILEEGFSMTENKSSMELSTSNKSPTEYICKSEPCQADKIENPTFTKLSEDERQHQTEVVSNGVEAGGDKVEAINETVYIEESTHQTEDGAEVSRQACAEEPMTDQYKSSEVIAESAQKGTITSQENENTRSKGEENPDLECIRQPISTSETNMGLISEAPLPNLDLTCKSQGEEDERVDKSCAKDETRDPTMHVEDEVKELSLDGAQKKKEDVPPLLGGECKDPESIGSSDKLENDNYTEDASTNNVEDSGFDAALKIGDNVDDRLESPYSDQVTDGVSTQVATKAMETLQEAASTVCRDEIKDIFDDSSINLKKHHKEKRDPQPKNGQEDQLGKQVTLILEETEVMDSRENAEKRVEQNILPVEEFEESGEKDEPTSTPYSGETSISTEQIPPLAESITKIKGEEMTPQEIATDLNSTDPLVGETGQPDSTDISQDSRINLEKHHEEKRDSQPKNGQEDQLGEQVTLIPEETEIVASRENAEKRVEQSILPVEEFEERREKDEPTSRPDSGETSISTEKIRLLAESITKIKGEENMIPQEIANDLNSTDSLVGETGQPDSTGEVPKTEAREEHQESSKFCSENNEQDDHLSETPSTENLVVKHMDSEAMVITATITKLTKDTEEPQKVPDTHSEDEIGIKGDEKIIPEETTEGEEAINKQLFATESITEDEDPSRLPTVASARDETIEQSSHEESLKDGEITLIGKNESHRPKDEAEESKRATEVSDLPNTRGRQDIYEQQITDGSVEEALNNFEENEKQIQNLRDDPHEEIKGENHVPDRPPEFIQNIGLGEGYSTATHLYSNPNECCSAESNSSADSSSLDKSPTQNICDSEHQIATKSEHQNEVEATEDKIIEEHHHDTEDDGAKISNLASIGEPNPKVHEEETSIDDKHLDQHLELITDQHTTFEVIPASTEKEMTTSQTNENTSKRDEDADLECNRQATSIFEKSCMNDEDRDTAMHVEDEFKEIIPTELQNERAGQVREVDWKDPESIRPSDKSEHENDEEFKLMTSSTKDASTVTVAPSPYIHSVEESTFETPSDNEDNDKEKLENPSSSLVVDGENTQAATEAGETMQDASNATCQDNNQDICESARQEIDVTPVDDIAKARDLTCQTGLPDNSEKSKINPVTHDGENRDLDHKNEQEHKVGEQAHLILENTEIEASRENDEKRMEQNIYSAEHFDVKEPTSAPNTRETSNSTEKSVSLDESISEINNEERISPQQIANNLNANDPLVEETGQLDSCDIVSITDAPEEQEESSEFCVEYNKQHEHHPETQSIENLSIKQVDPIVTTETVSESIKDIEEINKFPLSYSEEKIEIEEDEKFISEEPKEMEEAADKQSHETAKESISEDQAPSRLLITTLIRDEAIEQSTMEESLKGRESTLIEKNVNHRAENDAEEKIKAVQASEPSEAAGREDIYGQQIMERSLEGTMDEFQDNEKETEDASTEIKGENYDTGLPSEVNQNNELEERRSMTVQLESNSNTCSLAEFESFVESSSFEKLQTEKIFESEQFQADKAEAMNDISIEEPDNDIEHDSAKSSVLASAQKPNLKVHEEETSIDNSNLDQHLKVLTDQHASSEVIPESVEKEMITFQTNENMKSKREEDADLECNEQVTSTYEITLVKISEASLPNLELATKSRSEEDECVIESLTKDEGIETTKHVENESKDLSLTGIQDRKAEMAFVPEGGQKDLESIGSSNKLEHENNKEEDASTTNIVQMPYIHSAEESIFEAASKNEDNRENPSSNPVIDGASPQVAIEVVETPQEASYIACRDKNKDTCESVWPEEDVPPVDRMARAEDSSYLDRDAKGANEEDIGHMGLTETIEDSIINLETHDVEQRDSLQKNDQEYELGEQAVLIPEMTEEEAPREKAEKRIEQNTHSVEKFEEQEKDEPTSTPDSGETLISTEKSLPLAESTKKINSEKTIFPQNIASDLNTKDPLVEDPGNFNIDETGKETQTEAHEKFEDSSKTCTENDKQDEQHSEAQSIENLVIKHMYSEEMVTTNTIIKSTEETEELDRVPESLSQEKIDIKGDEKIIPEEPKEMEETTGVSENEDLSRLPRTASIGEEKIEHIFQEESLKDGAAMIDKDESCIPENYAEKDKKAVKAFDLLETKGRQNINEKQVIEESVEETMKSFQDDEIKIQILREDTRRQIEGKSSVSSLPSEVIQVPVTTASSQETIKDLLKVSEPSETEVSALKPEGEIESTAGTLSSATVGMDTRKEYMEEVECDQTKIKEEVEVTESEGQIEATSSIERKISNPLDDISKPKEDHADVLTIEENNTPDKGPSSILGVPKKDSSNTNDSEAEFLRLVNENTAMKEVKPVDVDHLEGFDVAHEMMDATSETKSNCLGGDIAERQEAETNSENRNIEVKQVVDQGEQISHEIKEKDLITGTNHEIELTTADEQLAHCITDSSMVPSYGEPKTAEMSKTTENTPAREDVLFVETETSSITHTEGALMVSSLDNGKGRENSNEGIQKHNDEDQPMPPNLKVESITSESDMGDIVIEKREQADGLADLNDARKLEIVDEKSTIEVTKTLLQEEELTEKTEDSSAVTRVEREAAELKTATSGSQEEYLNTKSGELLMEKGDFLAKDQSEEILLHSNNIQTEEKDNNLQDQDSRSVQDVPASNLKPRCNESVREHPAEGTIISPGEETENEVEVLTSKLTEQTESTKSIEGKKPLTSDNQTEQNMEITDLSALKSSDASETNIDDSSSTPKVYEKETEASFIRKDDSATDDPSIVPIIVEIEETGLKNSRTGHREYDRGSVIVSDNEGETAITTDKTTSDSTDTVGREENFNSEKEILEGLNGGNLKMDSCIPEREQSISTISMSQDYLAPLVEEKATMGNAKIHPTDAKSTREEIIDEAAETYLVHSIENTLPEKEHEVVKPGGTSDLESVNITEECSNGDSPQLKNEVNEEKDLVEDSKCTTNSTREDNETVQGQDNIDTTLESSLTNVAIEREEIALENEPADELPPEKTVEAADANESVEFASKSTAEDQRDEKIYQANEKSNCEDNVLESRENVPNKKIQGGIEREADMQFEIEHHVSVPRDTDAIMLGGCTENVPAATEMTNGSENIKERSPEPTSNLKESDTLSTCYETVDKATATNSGFIEQRGGMDLVEEREYSISENLAKANEDFSFTMIEASEEGLQTECKKENKAEISNKEDDTHTSGSLPCMPERNDVTEDRNIDTDNIQEEMSSSEDKGVKTGLDAIDTDNIQEERSSSEDGSDKKSHERAEGGCEMDQETKDKAPTTEDEPSAMERNDETIIDKGAKTSLDTTDTDNIQEERSSLEDGSDKKSHERAEVGREMGQETKDKARTTKDEPSAVERNDETITDKGAKTSLDTADTDKSSSEDGSDKKSQERAEGGREMDQETKDKAPTTGDEPRAMECAIKNSSITCQTVSNENQHEEKSEATEEGEYDNIKDNPPDDGDGRNVTEVATELTHEDRSTEPKITGRRIEIMAQGEKDQEVEAGSSQKENIDTAEVSESTREIKLEERSSGEVDMKATVKADAETRETNEDTEQGLHKPDGETKPEVQLEKAKSTNISVESARVEEANVLPSTEELLRAVKHLDEATDLAATAAKEETPHYEEAKAESEEDKEVEAESSQKEHIDAAEVSEPTREIQKLEERSLGEVDIKATVKADAESRETNEDIEQGLHKPDGETKPEVQLEKAKSTNITVESTRVEEENVSSSTEEPLQATKHLDEATDLVARAQKEETPQREEAKAESEDDEGVNGNETMEPLPTGASVMVEAPKDGEDKVKHKKSHNILSGVGSKVKHSISKVRKAITGKSSHPKTSSPN